jgi:hypothetical protein
MNKDFSMNDEELAQWSELNKKVGDDESYTEWISGLNIPQWMKDGLYKLVTFTQRVGCVLLNVGKIILNFLREVIQMFPMMMLGVLIGIVFGMLLSLVPFIGHFLSGLLTPFVTFALALLGLACDGWNYLTGKTAVRDAVGRAFEKLDNGANLKDAFSGFFSKIMKGVES